ncbi:uncharacterized protein LOC110722757 [Chenopodium quinoa]|nr:uncharacterized protein LOC110722757 [Chenopodium quinoa]
MSTIISPNSSLLILNPFSKSKSQPQFQSFSFNNPSNLSPSITSQNHPQFTPFPKTLTLTQPPKPRLSAINATANDAAKPTETLKTRLKNGETLYGLFLCSFSPTLAEIAGLAGYDFVVVDMEHGYGGIPEALTCLRSLAATGTPAILRLPESTAAWAKKALDLGPQGIMFPMIESPKEAQKAVSYCRYPPNGVRGAAHSIVRASGYGIDAGYLGNCEDELLIMCQVECEDAIEKISKIAAVEGVDCIQMGPLDLSASMGYLWDPGNKKVREKLRKAEKEVLEGKIGNEKNGGAYLAGFAMPHDSPMELKSRGYHMVSGAVDILLFRKAAVEDVRKFKISLEIGDASSDDDDPTAEGVDADDKYWSE